MVLFGFLSRSQIIWPVTTFATIFYAFLVSVIVGFFSSLYAAYKASRFDNRRKLI
jgi:ABC-type antimicrobial peptide transport system permease subunit